MANHESVAAALTAGMLYPVLPPATGPDGAIVPDEQSRFVRDVFHAVALYRAVLEALGKSEARRGPAGTALAAPDDINRSAVANFPRATDVATAVAAAPSDVRGGY